MTPMTLDEQRVLFAPYTYQAKPKRAVLPDGTKLTTGRFKVHIGGGYFMLPDGGKTYNSWTAFKQLAMLDSR